MWLALRKNGFNVVIDLESLLQPRVFAASLVALRPLCRHFYVNRLDYSNFLTLARGQVWESSSEFYFSANQWIKEDEDWLVPKINPDLRLLDSFSSICLLKIALDSGLIELTSEGNFNTGFSYFLEASKLEGIQSTSPEYKKEIWAMLMRFQKFRNMKLQMKALEQFTVPPFAKNVVKDSRIHVIGTAIEDNAKVISSNKRFSRWLANNDPFSIIIQPEMRFTALEKVMKKNAQELRIKDVFTILEHIETFDTLTQIIEQSDLRRSIRQDILMFFLTETAGAVYKPVSWGIKLSAILVKWRKQRNQEKVRYKGRTS